MQEKRRKPGGNYRKIDVVYLSSTTQVPHKFTKNKIRQSEVQSELEILQNELSDIDAALRVIKNISSSNKNHRPIIPVGEKKILPPQENKSKVSITDMITWILKENIEGMSVLDLVKEIHNSYDSNMERHNVATTLTRLKNKGIVVKSGNKLWALKKETSDVSASDVSELAGETVTSPNDSQEINTLAEPLVSPRNHLQKGGGNGS